MKVVIDATTTQNEWKNNGIGVYTRGLLPTLLKNFPKTNFVLLMYDEPSTIDRFLEGDLQNVEIIRIGKLIKKNLLNPLWYIKQVLPGIQIIPKLKKITPIDYLYFTPFFWGGIPKKQPFVVTIHDFAFPKFNIYSQISPLHNLARKLSFWYELNKVYKAKRIITDAKYTIKDVKKYLPKYNIEHVKPIHLSYEFYSKENRDVNQYLPDDWEKRNYLIYLGGGVTRNKNSHAVIEGYYRFARRLMAEDAKSIPYLAIAGKNFTDMKNKDVRYLHELVDRLNLEKLVLFTGFYDEMDKYSLLKKAFLCVHLSLYEGFGIGAVEAMYTGTPTIVHNGSCYPEVVGDGAILVDGENYDEVAQEMYKVYSDKKYAASIGRKGEKQARIYNWDRTAEKTHGVFKSVYNESIK